MIASAATKPAAASRRSRFIQSIIAVEAQPGPAAIATGHNRSMLLRIFSITALAATAVAALDTRAANLASIAPEAGGVVGVGVLHVESGQRASVRGGERFPMASVYKLPIAIAFLRDVDAGRASLDQQVSYRASDLRPGLAHSAINARLRAGAATATARELLAAMMIESDNTASDLVLRLAGGPGGVMARLREAGIEGVDVSRPEGQIALDYWGVEGPPPAPQWSLETFQKLRAQVPPARRRDAAARFASDPRDTATPDGMATLLARLQKGEALAASSTALLLDLMARATTGPERIKGRLPPGTPVAHKTGTGGDTGDVNCCTNDVGIVTLPDGSHLAVAVFVRSSPRDLTTRERAIARIARAAYESWTAGAR
jgi:beta-lactamase class A